jgi:hypothetical protein
MLIKLGESVFIRPEDIKPIEKLADDMDLDIENRMYKFAQELKVIAPKAKDFLYFTCVMMHAAEAACINDDGTPKKTSQGKDVEAAWESTKEGGVKWVCNEKTLMPYRNNNRDIFPEAELKVAYKNWVGRPLCLDHQSQSVDKIRGVIVDTVYDDRRKRVIALCALDAKNYGDLADKVKTGVANNVSMGTAVGRAVCSDCHRVARTEKDFCQHMKNKSCYGEINLDLTPIELSLVVSGADPKAKVKHIIASDIAKAAGLLSDYLEVKKGLSRQDLTSIQKDLQSLMGKIESMANDFDESDESDAVGPTRSSWSMEESGAEPSTQINPPEAFPTYASELQRAILGAQTKLASLQENLLRVVSNNEEPTMTKKNAYFQGTEEPKPGQAQYSKDPLNEKARLMDKNLHGPAPFPNTGDEEGMYPGDEKVKKELQRLADEHERALFREAALKKAKEQLQSKGYYLGTEEPKPGKVQYSKDPLNEKDRMLDKQMVGEKPFPGVGDVEGLYDDDEKEKEKLLRASLVKARFEKVALPDGRVNKSASSWVVYANDKAILRASVDQITKGNSESLYDAVATERFGKSLLNRIQTEGFQATADALLKNAQAAPAAPPAPPVDGAAGGADLPPLEPPKNVGGKGGNTDEIVDDLQSLFDEMGGKLSDLRDKVSGAVSEDADAMPDVEPAGDAEFSEGPKTASQLQSMRKRVNGMLQEGVDETITSLAKHMREINTAKRVYKETYASMTEEQREYLNALTISAVKDAKAMLVDAGKLMEAVVKYAYGTAELEKRASQKDPEKDLLDAIFASEEETEETADAADGTEECADAADAKDGAEDEECADAKDGAEEESADAATGELPCADEGAAEDGGTFDSWLANIKGKGASDKADAKLSLKTPDGTTQQLGEVTVTAGGTLELSTKEGRAQARIKLAEKGLLGFNELSNDAHPGGSVSAVDAGNLDVKPNVPGAEFHVPKDIQSYMLELANMPPRVRKQAEMIQALVAEGKMKADDVDKLVSHGVDAEAVKYWKELFGQGDTESKDFATKLTQEHAKAKQAEEVESYKGRIKRAYEVAHQMIAKGMITEGQLDSQVNDIMKWNDAGFESIKNILARQPSMNKQASIPMVGLLSSGEVILPMAKVAQEGEQDIKSFFDNYFESKGLKF